MMNFCRTCKIFFPNTALLPPPWLLLLFTDEADEEVNDDDDDDDDDDEEAEDTEASSGHSTWVNGFSTSLLRCLYILRSSRLLASCTGRWI